MERVVVEICRHKEVVVKVMAEVGIRKRMEVAVMVMVVVETCTHMVVVVMEKVVGIYRCKEAVVKVMVEVGIGKHMEVVVEIGTHMVVVVMTTGEEETGRHREEVVTCKHTEGEVMEMVEGEIDRRKEVVVMEMVVVGICKCMVGEVVSYSSMMDNGKMEMVAVVTCSNMQVMKAVETCESTEEAT
ncbi:hypothetical protein PanWU01x14_188690 [Parasponia andersonii]|uniref:Uncharacterized protein n=1 Tax=Parasponia andersonii TaxID=3476 RepID=A0A2P5C2Y0_PARAD|nr:hypothetical protein PanWU01x14_188690 [Parasponia andersonii]